MLESLQRQTYQDWVLIVVDNLSTDNTMAILDEAAALDKRIQVSSCPRPMQVNESMNFALEIARQSEGEFLQFLAGDDELGDSNYLELGVSALIGRDRAVTIGRIAHFTESRASVSDDFSSLPLSDNSSKLQEFAVENYWICNLIYGFYRKASFYSVLEQQRFSFTPNLSSDWWFSLGAASSLKVAFEGRLEYRKFQKSIDYSDEHYSPNKKLRRSSGVSAAIMFPVAMLGDRVKLLKFREALKLLSLGYAHLAKQVIQSASSRKRLI